MIFKNLKDIRVSTHPPQRDCNGRVRKVRFDLFVDGAKKQSYFLDNPCYGDCYKPGKCYTDENGIMQCDPAYEPRPKPPVKFDANYIVNNIIKDSSFPKDTIKYAMVNGQKLDFSKTYYVNIWGLDVVEIFSITK